MSNYVLVIDANKQPLSPCHPTVARKLLNQGRASVYRRYPFTIILTKTVENSQSEPIKLKLDPGSKTTGIALVQGNKVIWGADLTHRVLKFVKGFQTGDIVKAVVTSGKKVGIYMGRVAVRSSGSFNISLKETLVQGISHTYCSLIHRKDGYLYAT